MNDASAKIKQQIVEKIRNSTNILVTVSKDPSVDELSAALGLTAMLNKAGKHTTAIFSGAIPPAITFLEPDKTFENTIDSLRDFIIALDKEKADHLRYKVDGDVVKIFITPYRTVITGDDLEFSQGDYNVELVLALGVENQEHLDMALAAHGQILHDVTVATFSSGLKTSQLGAMDWHDPDASSLCEMVTNLSESFKTDVTILDKQIATALLTGIVAATDRFSNVLTSSRVMELAAQLMAAGADQQLIAAKLQESHAIDSFGATGASTVTAAPVEESHTDADGGLSIAHQTSTLPATDTAPVAEPTPVVAPVTPAVPAAAAAPAPDIALETSADNAVSTLAPSTLPPIVMDEKPAQLPDNPVGSTIPASDVMVSSLDVPQQNQAILDHSYMQGPELIYGAPINSTSMPEDAKLIDIFNNDSTPEMASTVAPVAAPAAALTAMTEPAAAPAIDNAALVSARDSDDARSAVEAALKTQSVPPTPLTGMPLPPPAPDFSGIMPPPVPSFDEPITPPEKPIENIKPAANDDPTQFKIPGQ